MDPEEQTSDLYGIIQSVVHVEWLSTALTVAIALAFTALVARAVTKVLRRVLSHDNSPLPSSSIFVNIARIAVWAVGVSVVLSSCFGIDVSAAITALGIGGIAISLGFQDTLSNLIGGVQVSITGLVGGGMSQEPQVLFTEAMECGYRASLVVWVEDGDKHSLVKDAVVRAVAPYTMA